MIDANPIFFSSGTASGLVAPPPATVVSRRAKFVTPGTVCLVTCCALARPAPASVKPRTSTNGTREDIGSAPLENGPHHPTGKGQGCVKPRMPTAPATDCVERLLLRT